MAERNLLSENEDKIEDGDDCMENDDESSKGTSSLLAEDDLKNSLDNNLSIERNCNSISNDESDARQLRKRSKVQKSPLIDSEREDFYSDTDEKTDDRESYVKKRRGRPRGRKPKKQSVVTVDKLPESATEGLDDDTVEQLQYGYSLYQTIISTPKITPFVEKPDPCLFGMASYLRVIRKPMWLKEIKRKLLNKEYFSLPEVVEDLITMIKNCYKFWGSDHLFSEKALQIEYKLFEKINSLPEPFREMCRQGFSKDGFPDEDDKNASLDDSKSEGLQYKNYQSVLLKTVLNDDETDDISETVEKEMTSWESKKLVSQEQKTEINSMWQLPAIGMFLKLTHECLYIKKINQYEIERMLLMPRESVTLATLMTTLLSPAVVRPKLEASVPVMPYQVWNAKLQKKVQEWFAIFYKCADEAETFKRCGIEPLFWGSMCILNPYDDKDFHELSFFQRAWILKALCDHIYHTNKSVQELFPDELRGNGAREVQLGIYNNYMYFYIPFWPDIRIYRQRIISSKMWDTVKDIGITTGKLLQQSVSTSYEDGVQHPRIEDFCLVAESNDDLFALIEETKEVNPDMCKKLKSFEEQAKYYPPNRESLRNLYNQWQEYQNRSENSYSYSINYWETEKFPSYQDIASTTMEPEVLGKRQRKVKNNIIATNMTSSESEEDIFDGMDDDEGSDWECPSEKKKAKKQPKPPSIFENFEDSTDGEKNKKKRAPKKRNEECNINKPTTAKKKDKFSLLLNSSEPEEKLCLKITATQSIRENPEMQAVQNKFDLSDVVIKEEKPEIKVERIDSEYQFKQEIDEVNIKEEVFNKVVEKSLPKVDEQKKDSNNKVTSNIIKKETKEDVISLSSSDEEDDVVLTTPKKNFPVPKILPSPPVVNRVTGSPRNAAPVRSPIRSQLQQQLQVRSPRAAAIAQPMRTPSPQALRNPLTQNRFSTSPRAVSPRQRLPAPYRNVSPNNNVRLQNSPARANLFPTTPTRNPSQPSNTVPAKVSIGKRDDGSLGYIARLADGGVIHLSRHEVEDIKRKHNNTIPPIVQIPLKPRFF